MAAEYVMHSSCLGIRAKLPRCASATSRLWSHPNLEESSLAFLVLFAHAANRIATRSSTKEEVAAALARTLSIAAGMPASGSCGGRGDGLGCQRRQGL